MSEIKGQLLGLLLVLAVFAVVKTAAVAMFQKTADGISTKIEQEVSANVVTVTPNAFEVTL
jgi:hypothetical protein